MDAISLDDIPDENPEFDLEAPELAWFSGDGKPMLRDFVAYCRKGKFFIW